MRSPKRHSTMRTAGVSALVIGAVAVLLAVATGLLTSVTTVGSSMNPGLRHGDLALVRSAGSYGVGDVVAYRSAELGGVVLHRIVEDRGGRFVVKGDSNDWLDTEQPTDADVVGKLWLRIPHGGEVLARLRQPQMLAALVAVFLGAAGLQNDRKRRTARRQGERPMSPSRTGEVSQSSGQARAVLQLLGATLAGCVALGAFAFARPETTQSAANATYSHRGAFSYETQAPAGSVYDGDAVRTGEPVFLQVADQVRVGFDYRLETDAAAGFSGTVRLDAELRDAMGWKRTVAVAPPTKFLGTEASARGRLDLGALRALLAEFEESTGMRRGSYTVALVPTVEVLGAVHDQRIRARFSPSLDFQLDGTALRLTTPVTDKTSPTTNPLLPALPGTVRYIETGPGQLSLFGRHLDVAQARTVSLVLGGAAAIGLLALALALRLFGAAGAAARIDAVYGSRIVSIRSAGGSLPAAHDTFDVSSIRDLVRLADQHDAVILHERRDGSDSYLVDGGRAVYRYSAPVPQPRAARVKRSARRVASTPA